MNKQTLYPKTERISNPVYQITEKLDGSNLGFFNLFGELLIAQRSNTYKLSEIDNPEVKGAMYGGLYKFLKEHGETLLNSLYSGSGVFGEWIGMGKIKYGGSDIDKPFYIFAKANIAENYNEDYEISNLYWKRDLLKYSFILQEPPEFMGFVPLVAEATEISLSALDALYEEYTAKVNRKVEGFVIMLDNNGRSINKYVRFKNGKPSPHFVRGE